MGCRQEPPSVLFWRHAVRGKYPDSCWEWKGAAHKKGYGRQWSKQRGAGTQASRISWEIHIGPIPPGLYVCHTCDNPPCTNPDHLFLATHAENMRDMIRKGRHRWGRTKHDNVT
jgi:HNH endonuclease